MNIIATINKNTAFFYWLQTVSKWDTSYAFEHPLFTYYHQVIQPADNLILSQVRTIIQSDLNPYDILRKLYGGEFDDEKSRLIAHISTPLIDRFDSIWQDCYESLVMWRNAINDFSYDDLYLQLQKIAVFLGLDRQAVQDSTVFLLPPRPEASGPAGHKISSSNFILLRPPYSFNDQKKEAVRIVILHEYAHGLIQQSKLFQEAGRLSYETLILPKKLVSPSGYTWRSVYNELLAYCIASRTIGGYLSPQLTGRPYPAVDELRPSFERLLAKRKPTSNQIINWASLHMLPKLTDYIEEGKTIDAVIFEPAVLLINELFES
ncbi:hypothetical protein [Candidatus Nanosynsacchari sp. TM7_ANC_38.39_G1_1]|uniref:hypothetical protein n=1 Tax=Candidatus Nanosynsacchari sp. TM7_ANC_38.39_G1_1 TaxID=1986206 RepID=UPI00101C3291|nr:hypothetical protein [Candidatus Nanosynsacchari sp. TM7_ANC_38.39_G1_1]